MRNSRLACGLVITSVLVAGGFAGCTCGTDTDASSPFGTQSSGSAASGTGGGGLSVGCKRLECQQVDCAKSGKPPTTVSGTIYDPGGTLPLYNIVAYVPNAPLEPVAQGASCDTCGATLSGSPIVTALTDTHGRFVLENVPVGTNIPLVIQVGKWRREITIPSVTECTDNPLGDKDLTRLPKNTSEGHIPLIALTTGGADPLECLLRKIGLEDSVFTPEGGAGRVHFFAGNGGSDQYTGSLNGGAPFTPATTFWGDLANLMEYDIVLLACEGARNLYQKPAAARQALFDYTLHGGRVFASHWHNVWLEKGPDPFPMTATFNHQPDLPNPFTALIDQSFPKGAAMADWLMNVAGSTVLGEIEIRQAQHTVDAVNANISQQWIYGQNPTSVQYFTFNTPVGAMPGQECGRLVFSDIHVSSGDHVGDPFPDGCTTTDLTPQEKALLFMLFDLSACIQDDGTVPIPPPV